ncbi:MAG: hypothetical protein JOY86_06460 [Candidatus Eremiobacteraeota bacterium]|nr:hypothetical protein [Candidatus Eremiobacteraeota bacterium]
MARDEAQMRTLLYGALKGGTSVVMATVGSDNVPSTALNSWIVAKNERVVASALDTRSSAYANISAGRLGVAFELLADDLILAIKGTATIVKERLASVPFPCALVHIDVESIRDHTAADVHFLGPRYTYADHKGHRSDAEAAIFAELALDVSKP